MASHSDYSAQLLLRLWQLTLEMQEVYPRGNVVNKMLVTRLVCQGVLAAVVRVVTSEQEEVAVFLHQEEAEEAHHWEVVEGLVHLKEEVEEQVLSLFDLSY